MPEILRWKVVAAISGVCAFKIFVRQHKAPAGNIRSPESLGKGEMFRNPTCHLTYHMTAFPQYLLCRCRFELTEILVVNAMRSHDKTVRNQLPGILFAHGGSFFKPPPDIMFKAASIHYMTDGDKKS